MAAATQCLADATHLHIKVLEDMLHQERIVATLSEQQQIEVPSFGMAAMPADSAKGAAAAPNQDLWAACLLLQADVDLAVAQICNMRM
jgi:hypothetical protein